MADVDTGNGVQSDLLLRFISAVVMVLVAGSALWFGGWVWIGFVALIGLGILWEWTRLAFHISGKSAARAIWVLAGIGYIGIACYVLISTRVADTGPDIHPNSGLVQAIVTISMIIGVDVGAYFVGRFVGGPKIAPSISPSKTWTGLIGGMGGAFLALLGSIYAGGVWLIDEPGYLQLLLANGVWMLVIVAVLVAVIAQAGDFFESWMKRRARVKDSSDLIPGHGGLFDRCDGLLAVCFCMGAVLFFLSRM